MSGTIPQQDTIDWQMTVTGTKTLDWSMYKEKETTEVSALKGA